jgi:hypothetical protein
MTPVADTGAPPGPGFSNPADTWNRRFSEPGYHFGTAPNAWLAAQADVWPVGARVLCVADGEGRNSVWLARRGLAVQAFDIAEQGVAKARKLAAEQGVEVDYVVADCDSFAWPVANCDGVAAIFIQFADPLLRERLFARMVDSLRPEQAQALRFQRGFGARAHVELAVDLLDVVGDGVAAQAQLHADLGQRVALGHAQQHFAFALGERHVGMALACGCGLALALK